MRTIKLSLTFAVAAMLLPVSGWAADPGTPYQPVLVTPAAYESDSFRYFAPDEVASVSPGDEIEAVADLECCESLSCGCCSACELGEPWTLFGETCNGITAGGWVSSGLYSNGWGAPTNGLLGMRSVADGYTMNQMWVYLEKAMDTSNGWDWGFRTDFMYGVDGPDYQSFGDQSWDFGWNSSRDYGSTMPNLYAEIGCGNLTVKGGHFITTVGWECLEDTGNFFTSRSMAFYYAEPTTHTGFLANYDVSDDLSFQGGWVAGWDAGWANNSNGSMMLGGATFTVTDDSSIIWAFTAGDLGDYLMTGVPQGNQYMNSICFEWLLSDQLTYVLAHDYGSQKGTAVVAPSQWASIGQYLTYQLNDCWSTGARLEWFHDDEGARTGTAGDLYDATLGLNYKPHANLTIRPEIRYDWVTSSATPYNGHQNQVAGGFDVIFTF